MDCLRDFIGISWCGNTTTPPSGLYINQLPGISFKGLQGIADSEQVTFAGVWDDIQTRAIKRFSLDVKQKLSKLWSLASIQQSLNLGTKIDDTLSQALDTTKAYGYVVELDCSPDDDFVSSLLQELYLQQLYVFTTAVPGAAVTAKVIVFDIASGHLIKQKTVSLPIASFLTNGWTKIDSNINFIKDKTDADFSIVNNTQKYFIGVNFSVALNIKELILPNSLTSICGCCEMKFKPANVAVVNNPSTYYNSTITYTTNPYGISAIMGSRCAWDRLVCANKDVFATSFWYLLGIETMNEQINSDRLNRYTTIDLKRAEKLKTMWELHYMGGQRTDDNGNTTYIKGALTQAVETIDLDCSDCCVECEGELKLMESTL